MARRRPEAWRTGYAIRGSGGGLTAATVFGNEWFYDSTASTTGNGKNPDQPTTDFETLLGAVGNRDVIYCAGDIRAQVTAPQDVFGVRIIGAVAGRPRHVTDSGVVITGNGCAWREEATAAGAPLLTLREQGWEIHNILMTPESGYSAVKLHRTELSAAMDASHFVARGVRFSGGGSQVGLGIEDYGGNSHCSVLGCEFDNLEYGIYQSNAGIDWANRWLIGGLGADESNFFRGNKNDIVLNGKMNRIVGNVFGTVYDGTTHPKTVDVKGTADGSVANYVLGNFFKDNAADVTIAKGYIPATGDVWRNKVANTAADIVTVPS
jgi:hypothetical protein